MDKDYIPTMEEKIEDFFDIMDSLRSIYYENFRLKQENTKLREECQKRYEQIMDMSRMSQEGLNNWIQAMLDGKIKLNND